MAQDAPAQQAMDNDQGGVIVGQQLSIESIFGPKDSILVKQTMKGCIQECCGCEAKSEYKVSAMDWAYVDGTTLKEGAMTMPDEMYILEESNCCLRICLQDGRPMVLNVSTGAEPGGTPIVQYKKPCGCPVMFTIRTDQGTVDCPCCCMLPEVTAITPSGQELNKTKYNCDQNLWVPKFMYSEGGQNIYLVKPETCCGGCCMVCKCGKKNMYQIPFYFWDPVTGDKIAGKQEGQEPQITKVWAGLKKECCSTADNFHIAFPEGIAAERKAGLLGACMLVDFVFFEGRQAGE